MADEQSGKDQTAHRQPNALTAFAIPKMDLVGPTVDDDIRRTIWRYGAEAVKKAVKEATKPKRGLSIGVQSGPPIGAQKGPPCGHLDRLMLGAGFALLAA